MQYSRDSRHRYRSSRSPVDRFHRSPDRSRHDRRRSRSPRRRSRSPSRQRRYARPSPGRRRSPEPEYSHRRLRRHSRSPVRRDERHHEPPSLGAICRAKVHTIKPFGIFVAVDGFERHALVHHTHIAEELILDRDDDDQDKITALEYFCRKGSEVWVKITEIREDAGNMIRVNCSMKSVDQESGKDLDPENKAAQPRRTQEANARVEPPEIGSIHRATVASVRPFGAFVRIDGYRSNGLVHFSQISDHMEIEREDSDEAKQQTIAQILSIGEQCWVKVVEVKDWDSERGPKVGCSIKLVSQKDGADLDPHGLKFRPKQADGSEPRRNLPVGAAAGAAQQGVVDWGHLNADKVNMDPKYANYELVGDEVERLSLPGPPPGGPPGTATVAEELPGIGSVEEALAILKRHAKDKKKGKKKSKDKKSHSEKKKKKKKKKQSKKSRRSSSSSSKSEKV